MATRSELRTRARARANQDSSTFPTDAQYNTWISESAKSVFGNLLTSGYPVASVVTDITATGAATYVVNTNVPAYEVDEGDPVFGVTGVYSDFGGMITELRRVNEGDKATLRSPSARGQTPVPFYEVKMDPRTGLIVIEFYPRPTSGAYQVEWIPDLLDMTSDGDTFNGPNRSDELVVLLTARKGILKEGPARAQEAAIVKAEYDELLDEVKRLGSWLDMRNAASVRTTGAAGMAARIASFDYPIGGGGYDF